MLIMNIMFKKGNLLLEAYDDVYLYYVYFKFKIDPPRKTPPISLLILWKYNSPRRSNRISYIS